MKRLSKQVCSSHIQFVYVYYVLAIMLMICPADSRGQDCRMKITFSGYNRLETLTNFPALIAFRHDVANSGFMYNQFASLSGWDLRFRDSTETQVLNYEIEKWDTNGTSYV